MLWSSETLRGCSIRATDGRLGSVHDILFDDESWTVRYLVVDTAWLFGRRVLLTPAVLGQPAPETRDFPVSLTREQVKRSPEIDTDQPVPLQHEMDLHHHYGWTPYWADPVVMPAVLGEGAGIASRVGSHAPPERRADRHLRSAHEMKGYDIHASDGDFGHVDDFLVEDEGWMIRYFVVDTARWLPGKRVLVAPQWITKIDWADQAITVDLPRERIESSPEYQPDSPIDRPYAETLYSWYGRPRYWE